MAFYCDTYTLYATATAGQLFIDGYYANAKPDTETTTGAEYGLSAGLGSSSTFGSSFQENDPIGGYLNLGADTTYYARCFASGFFGYKTGGTLSAKTNASLASMATPTSSAVASTTATIASGTITPSVSQSTYTLYLYYKKASDPSYTLAGSVANTTSLSVNLTGLTSSTQYYYYAYLVRTTNNDTTATSSVQSFTTSAGEPLVTTDAANNVTATSARLNLTLDINEGTGVTVYWKYGIQNPPTDTTTASQAASADGAFSVVTGVLLAETLYYAQAFTAFATPTGTPNNGSVVSFTTSADPLAASLLEDHLVIQEYDAVYGVQKAFVFLAASPSATSSNIFLSAAAPWATTECRITKDGGTVADCTNAPTRIGTSAFYTITLTATEMQAEDIWVHISDSSAAARDVALHVRTSIQVGKIVADASQLTNTSAILATGIGSGHGLSCVGGATGFDIDGILGQHVQRGATATAGGASSITLDASASATNDYYNGSIIMIVGGTGVGQARVITDYVGSTLVATVDSSWSTNPASGSIFVIIGGARVWDLSPAAELSAIPSATASYGDKLQALFQRFFFKRTQTVTTQTLFKANSSSSLGTATVSDDGATQSSGKIS